MKTKKPEFEPDKYYIIKPQFRLLGKDVNEFMDKIKEHKYYHNIWWTNEEFNKEPDELVSYWNSLFGKVNLLEHEFVDDLRDWFGVEKAKHIIRAFKEDNFHVVKTMRLMLNKDGSIKPRQSESTGRVIDDFGFKPILEEAKKQSEGQPKIKKGWLTGEKK